MSKLNQHQITAILKRINDIPDDKIVKLILDGFITIDKCIENKINDDKKIKIEELLLKKKEDKEYYKKINNNEVVIQELQRKLNQGIITKEGLIKHCKELISEEIYNKIVNYQKQPTKFLTEEDEVKPLKKGAYTDIYFFGKAGSGKSCVLASIFDYGQKNGLFIDDNYSLDGINYKNQLVRELNYGVLPDSTQADTSAVTYVTTTLVLDEETKDRNNLNIIEMSGELFQQAAVEGISKENLSAKGYLNNKNKKLLFFIFDYNRHANRSIADQGTTQAADFTSIINHLADEKILNNTYCIYIIINKSDCFPSKDDKGKKTNKDDFAENFFNENYKDVKTYLKSHKEKFGFEVVITHFSIGELVLNNSYLLKPNYESPEKLIKSISEYTARENNSRGKRFLKKYF